MVFLCELGALARNCVFAERLLGTGRRGRLALGLGFGLALRLALRFGFAFAFGLAFALRFAVGIGFRLRFPIRACGRLLAVAAIIGDVAAGSLELPRRKRSQPFQSPAAAIVDRQARIREFLPVLEGFTTLGTSIIVKWHSLCCSTLKTCFYCNRSAKIADQC